MRIVSRKGIEIGKGMPKVCVPIVGQTKEEIIRQAKEIAKVSPDLVEFRMDAVKDLFLKSERESIINEIANLLPKSILLATFRTSYEGGREEITFDRYQMLLEQVAELDVVDCIDVETNFVDVARKDMMKLIEKLHKHAVVVGSNHHFHETPEKQEMIDILFEMKQQGVDIAKLAVMPESEQDVLDLMGATLALDQKKEMDIPVITMSMGKLGGVTRIAGELTHSAVTFASMSKENASAPGQIEYNQLKAMLEVLH